MRINITGRNIDITPPLHKYVTGKLARIKKHFSQVTDIHVVLDVDKHDQHVEATINGRGGRFFADSRSSDMYAAIDLMVDKLDRQVLKHKEKLKDHSHDVALKSMPLS